MVNLITGQKGSGKTQQIIAIANEKVKTANGNVVLIKKSHRDTYSVDFNVRAICMAEFQDIRTQEELDDAEADYVVYRLKDLALNPMPG